MHAISSYCGNRSTNTHKHTPQTHRHTERQDRLQYTAPQLARSVTSACCRLVTHCAPPKIISIREQLFELSCGQTDRQTDETDRRSENVTIADFGTWVRLAVQNFTLFKLFMCQSNLRATRTQ